MRYKNIVVVIAFLSQLSIAMDKSRIKSSKRAKKALVSLSSRLDPMSPTHFVEQLKNGPAYERYDRGIELLGLCTRHELQAIWRYALDRDETSMGAYQNCTVPILDVITKKGSPQALKTALSTFCKDLSLTQEVVNRVFWYFMEERYVKDGYCERLVPDDIALECLDLLLKRGARIDCDTVFYLVQSERILLIDFLLSKGALNPNAKATNGTPIWHLARSISMRDLLIKYGNTQKNSRDDYGMTLLHRYARDSSTFKSEAEHLLKVGSNINAKDNDGNTPLHIAVQRYNPVVQAWLLFKGANCWAKNKAGEIALPIKPLEAFVRQEHTEESALEALEESLSE